MTETIIACANQLGVPFYILKLDCVKHVLIDRIKNRARDEKDALEVTVAVLEKQIESQDPSTAQEVKYVFNPAL